MNNKDELKKQVIILSIVLILVIVLAIILNTGKGKNISTNIVNNNESNSGNSIVQEKTEEEKMLENLKGLLQEPKENKEEYIQDETEGTNEKTVTTNNGETVIIKE